MLKRIGIIAAILLWALPVLAQLPPVSSDRCQTGLKQTVAFNISSATDTSLIAPITGANIYVCGFSLDQAVGTGTFILEYGTGATCGTGQVQLAGPYTAPTATPKVEIIFPNGGFTQFITGTSGTNGSALVPSQRMCAKTTGTIVQGGHLTYVQE